MNRRSLLALAVGAVAASGVALAPPVAASPVATPTTRASAVCGAVAVGHARCLSQVLVNSDGKIHGSPQPNAAAFGPAQVQAAYGLAGKKSRGRTVAIVDAFGYPTLESDLAAFRSHYNLPACTTDSGCLKVVGQDGGAPPVVSSPDWDLEQALDLDAVSSACPDCKILMVQATTNLNSDLATAVNTAAAAPGVVAISNSYGSDSSSPNTSDYDHPGIAVVASTGDSGYQQEGSYPANDTHVVAVGGTTVKRKAGGGYTETAWDGAGSGCGVAGNPRPTWQPAATTTCKNLDAGADVSAAADPDYGGLNVYAFGMFTQVGGTSESSPIIAAVFALSGRTAGYPARYLWAHANSSNMHDPKAGTNGTCGVPLCKARVGWDGPTGLGTPNGVGAF